MSHPFDPSLFLAFLFDPFPYKYTTLSLSIFDIMTLYERLPLSRDGKRGRFPKRPTVKQLNTKYCLLKAKEIPSWYSDNSFVRIGYRPVYGSVKKCFNSWRFVHNETVNIYSHLIPAAIALASNGFLHLYFRDRYPNASLVDQLAFHVYLTTSVICFGISSLYHTLLCHSEAYSGLWVRFDYVAILIQTVGSFISGIYVSFYCEPGLQKIYWTMIGVLGSLSTFIVLNPRFQSGRWRTLRLSTFVATAVSGLLPVIHATYVIPYDHLTQQTGFGYYLLEGLALIAGVFFYATHFPEYWIPEKFDIWGASHQIFHLFVVLSAAIHLWTLFSVFDWNYNNPQCSV
ncbi:mPR-like GPCR protein [Aspergillus karnatakaensis]|uniref:hemolysin III family protein n=1 Tax=Aspergillus karnatakaensis TaxID=1810916 RepID=UPI003CCD7583